MKKLFLLVLCTMIISFAFTGCLAKNKYVTNTDTYFSITSEKALSIGKQEAVNHFCEEENVGKLKMIYGTEDVTRKTEGGWEVHLKGYYYPVDSYGMVGVSTRFAFTVHIDNSGEVEATFEY